MGKTSFLLPPQLPADLAAEVRQSCLAGSFDNSPVPTIVQVVGNRLDLTRDLDESGAWMTPWDVDDCGRLMISTSTLIADQKPYSAAVELARGKLNQLRNALAEWQLSGDRLPDQIICELSQLNQRFAKALCPSSASEADALAGQVLVDACRLGDRLVPLHAELMLQRNPVRRDATFGCQLSQLPPLPAEFCNAFNTVSLSLGWRDVEPLESQYSWETADTLLDWAEANGLQVVAGPLIDFSPAGLPDWLSLWEGDVPNLANFMCDYVETAINRYRGRIRRWQLSGAANLAGVLGLTEDEALVLTAKLAETAQQIAPGLDLTVGVAQPWGDYLSHDQYTYTPLVFLDQLLRHGLRLSGIHLELVPGVLPRGSYCRDFLEFSRIVDHYSSLGAPVHITLGFPSSDQADPAACGQWRVTGGRWRSEFSEVTQAEWAEHAALVVLSKPFVGGLVWTNFTDSEPHQFPNCGLVNAQQQPKAALSRLARLRQRLMR